MSNVLGLDQAEVFPEHPQRGDLATNTELGAVAKLWRLRKGNFHPTTDATRTGVGSTKPTKAERAAPPRL